MFAVEVEEWFPSTLAFSTEKGSLKHAPPTILTKASTPGTVLCCELYWGAVGSAVAKVASPRFSCVMNFFVSHQSSH